MSFYSIPLAILIVISAILTLLMFTPVVVLVDSRSRHVKVRWSFLLSYVGPFPGVETGQGLELSVAGISVQRSCSKGRQADHEEALAAEGASKPSTDRQNHGVRDKI